MKKLIIPLFSCLMVFGMMLSCRKVDNPKLPGISRAPLPLLTDSLFPADQLLPVNGAVFSRSITLDVYFKQDIKPKSMDLIIVKNGSKTNYNDSSIKILQAAITSFPTTITFDQSTIQTLFGTTVALGDIYEISANITAEDGTVYPAFTEGVNKAGTDTVLLAGGSPYGSDIASLTGSNVLITYKAPCEFDASVFSGGYKIVEDDWADYAAGDAVPSVTLGPGPNQLTLVVYPSVAFGTNRKPMIVTIDPTNAGAGNASVPLTVIGDYGGAPPNATIKTNANTSKSFVDFCTGEIHLDLDFDLGAAGAYPGNTLDITH